MSQGGYDETLHIVNVTPIAAPVVPSTLLALPTLQLPAPVLTVTVAAKDIPYEDFSQEGLKARAHQRLRLIRHSLSSDHGIARAFRACADKLAKAATAACHQLYITAISTAPSKRTFSDARQILWRWISTQETEDRALHTGSLDELSVHSRAPFDPRRPGLASYYKKSRRDDVDATSQSPDLQAGYSVGPSRHSH